MTIKAEVQFSSNPGGIRYLIGTADPAAGAGIAAATGSLYLRSDDPSTSTQPRGATLYMKHGSADTAWRVSDLAAYNVKAFGAAGDGSTNDAPNVQAALSSLLTAGGGDPIFPGRDI